MSLYSSNLIILFPVGCCLYIVMRLADARADTNSAGAFRAIIGTLIAMMISIALMGLVLRIGRFHALYLIGLPVIGIIFLAKSTVVGRAAMLLSFLHLNPGGRVDPSRKMAGDFARLNSGLVRRRASRVAEHLARGRNLASSLELARIAKSNQEALVCRAVAKYGPNALDDMPAALHPLGVQAEIERQMSRLSVLPWLLQGIPVVILIVYLIVPTIRELVDENGVKVVEGSLAYSMMEGSRSGLLGVLPGLLFLLGLPLSGVILLLVVMPQLIHVAPFRYAASSYHRAESLMSLAIASKHESNLLTACHQASRLVPSPHSSRKFELIAEDIGKGKSPQSAFVDHRLLGKPEALLLGNALATNSLAWALQQIAVSQTERMLQRLAVFTQVAVLICILGFGAFYGAFAFFLINMLSQLILNLS